MHRAALILTLVVMSGCPGGGGGGTGGGTAGGVSPFGGGVTSTGGGAVTGGGSAGSSGGGSTVAGGMGGGAAMGGGSSSMGGSLVVPSFVFDPKVVASADGAFHLVHRTQTPGSIVYGRCTSNCGVATRWTFVTIEPSNIAVRAPRIAVGADGRVHVVYTQSSPSQHTYATCAANCETASNWSKTLIPTPGNCDWEDQNTGLVLDTAGRLSFMSSDGNTENLCLNTCAGSCTTASNWENGSILNLRAGGRRVNHAFAGHGTTLHLVFEDLTAGLRYSSCTGNCTQFASWQQSNPLFFHGGEEPVALSVSPQGRLALAFNQGTTDASAPAAVKMFDNRLGLWECTTNCSDPMAWQGVVVGAEGDGKNGVATASTSAGLVAVSAESSGSSVYVCEANCGTATNWTGGALDTAPTLTAALPDAYSVLGCTVNGQMVRPQSAGWVPERPVVALSTAGLVVHTMTKGLRTCPGLTTPATFPGYGRLHFAPP